MVRTRRIVEGIAISLIVWGAIWAFKRYKGSVAVGGAQVVRKGATSWVDPCPGDNQIWDAATSKCIPLVEEPVAFSGKKAWN
jgi:hypothetical protein